MSSWHIKMLIWYPLGTARNAGGLLSACSTSKSQACPIEIGLLYLKKRDTMAGVEQSTAIDLEKPTPEQETHPPGRRGRRASSSPQKQLIEGVTARNREMASHRCSAMSQSATSGNVL